MHLSIWYTHTHTHTHIYIYICILYQRRWRVHIYTCVGWYVYHIAIYLGSIILTWKCFISTNNGSILKTVSYRVTKFLAKMDLRCLSYCSPVFISVLVPQLTTYLSASVEKQTFWSMQSLIKNEITMVWHYRKNLSEDTIFSHYASSESGYW